MNPCSVNATCLIPNGTQDMGCICNRGYIGNGTYCEGLLRLDHLARMRMSITFLVDVQECLQNNTCPENSECHNTAGGFICSCRRGYIGLRNLTSCNGELFILVRQFEKL